MLRIHKMQSGEIVTQIFEYAHTISCFLTIIIHYFVFHTTETIVDTSKGSSLDKLYDWKAFGSPESSNRFGIMAKAQKNS